MRISSLQFFQQNLRTFNNSEARMLELQKQIASGVSVDQASDNPEAFVTALKAQDVINQAEQYNRNITLSRLRLTQQEESLGSVNDILSSVRETALQARSGVASDFDRSVLAQELRIRSDELRNVLNTTDIDGLYIFAGGNQINSPLTGNGALTTVGNGSPIQVDIAPGRVLSTGFDPQAVFSSKDTLYYTDTAQGAPAVGNARQTGSVVQLVTSLAIAIEKGDMAEVDRLTRAVEKNNDAALTARVAAGTRSRQLDDAENFNLDQIVQASEAKEKSVGADLSETITQLTQTDAQLRALQVTYSQITKNSLFDLI